MTLGTRKLAVLAAVAALAGCADMTGIQPHAQMRTSQSMGLAAEGAGTAAPFNLKAEWWKDFGDADLDRLVAQALENNPNLGIAQSRLSRAQALVAGTRSTLLPQVGAEADAQRQKFSANNIYPPPIGGAVFNLGTLQLNGSWELDFFGKNRNALNAALTSEQAAQADEEAARVLLATNVTREYFQLARLNDQIEVAHRALAQREEAHRLVQDRVTAGLDTSLELKQAEGAIPESRQQLAAFEEQAELARHALAALVGQGNAPIAASPSFARMHAVPVPHELPADLLGRRADIAAARWRVEAAGYDVKSAKAEFYPNVNLTAFAGLSSIGFSNLLHVGSEQWGVGPAIRLPIFEGGRLRANLRGKTADLDAAVQSYNATLLDAIHDAADQITSSQSLVRQQEDQRLAQQSAEAAYDIAIQRYKAGLGTYLNVLSAEITVLAQRRLGVDLEARAFDTQVALIHALGGGYTAQPAQPAIASK